MESLPQNPEFRNNPENFLPYRCTTAWAFIRDIWAYAISVPFYYPALAN